MDRPAHLFAYGTLLPGDVRWPLLAAYVVDEGWPDQVAGALYDTGLGYPAAVFSSGVLLDASDHDAHAVPPSGVRHGIIRGRTFVLLETSLERALDVLDEEEDTVAGLYRRVRVRTASTTAWAYAYGSGLTLDPIPSGDWLDHRGASRPPVDGEHVDGEHTERSR